MKSASLMLCLVSGFFALSAVAQQPPAERPGEPANMPVTAESLFKEAQALATQKQPDKAIAALQHGLTLAPTDGEARLKLARFLMQQSRATEAIGVLRTALQYRNDLTIFEALLSALRTAGSPIDLAMTAEQAVAKHPGHIGLLQTTTEALLAVGAFREASGYWQKLPQTEQNTPLAQWLLGSIHEAAAQPALAWAAYTNAAPAEAKAKLALQRLSAQSIQLSGWRYFVPPQWTILHGAENTLVHANRGFRANFKLFSQTSTSKAAQSSLMEGLPLPPEEIATLLAQTEANPQALVRVERLTCPGASLCLHAGPAPTFAGHFPEFFLAVLELGTDALTVVIDNASHDEAMTALKVLIQKTWLSQGKAP